MKNFYKGILAALTVFLYAGNTLAQSSNYEFRIIYGFMKAKDVAGLKNAVTNGVWIDSPDSNGINSLCHAIYQKDYDGYNLLRNMSADPNPPCLRRMSPRYRNAFFENQPGYDRYAFLNPTEKKTFFTPRMQTFGTTALMTGMAVAILAGSGGGGGSNNPGGGDGDIQWTDVEVSPTSNIYLMAHPANGNPDDYKTEQVIGSGFLEQINAPAAYARGYDGRKVYRQFKEYHPGGNLPTFQEVDYTYSDEVVNVAVYDNGVWANNIKLKDNIVKFTEENGGGVFGFNFDFGPCSGVNKTMCYSFDATKGKLMLQNGAGQPLQEVGSMSQETWNTYISHFSSDYVWKVTDTTPHYINGPQTDAPKGYDPNEINGHGTHVAGIIGAKPIGGLTQGVVQNVGLLPFIYNQFGNIDTHIGLINSTIEDFGNMMDSKNQDIQIVNMSLGPGWREDLNAQNYGDYFNQHTNLDTFFNKGRILVVAAGNEGKDESGVFSAIPKEVTSADGLFVSVVAVDQNNNLASYSNKCGSAANWCIAAPGGTEDHPIKSTYGENTVAGLAGTSMAAPVVSGSLAMIMSAFPNLTPQQAVHILFETATDLGAPGVDEIYGHGLVNLEAATMPLGVFEVPTEDTVSGASVALSHSKIAVPYNMANIIEKLPQQMIFLDKYERPYPLETKSLFTTSNHNKKLENDMKQFTNRNKIQKIAVNNNLSMSFSNRISDPVDNMQLGSFAFDYMVDKDTSVGFFFSENTAYKNGDYFSKATSNPFLNMNEAFGIKSAYKFNQELSFDVAVYTGKNGFYNDDQRLKLQNDNEFNAIDYVFNFTPADYVTFGFKGGFLQEDGSVLGMNGSGAFATENSLTNYFGLEIGLMPVDDLSITAAYYQGRTQTRKAKSNTLMSLSDIKSESISLDIAYKLNQEAKLGLQIAQPLTINRGSMLFDLPVGRDPKEDIIYREKYNLKLKPEAREIDLGLYFTHETEEDKWFRAEFGTRINPDNRDVTPDYRIMLGFGAPLN